MTRRARDAMAALCVCLPATASRAQVNERGDTLPLALAMEAAQEAVRPRAASGCPVTATVMDVSGTPRGGSHWASMQPHCPHHTRLEHVFDRLCSERPHGERFGQHSGQGLSISRQIVEALKGSIAAENRRGRWSGRGSWCGCRGLDYRKNESVAGTLASCLSSDKKTYLGNQEATECD